MIWTGSGGTTDIIIFFALTIVASAALAIDGPTRNAITPEILGPRLTPSGIALNAAAMQFAMPVSIFASGLMIDHLGHGAVFAISSFGHLGEVVILAMMSYRTVFSAAHMAARQGQGAGQAVRDIAAGLRFARSRAVILWTVLIVVLMMSLIMPPTGTLGPQWVTTVVGASWSQFSYIAVFWGGGAMIASLFLVRFSWIERKGLLTGIGVMVMALGFVVFTNPPTVINAMMGNLLLGVGMSTAMVSANATLAYETPNEMRGRIMGLVFLGMGIAQAAGLPLGAVAQAPHHGDPLPAHVLCRARLPGGHHHPPAGHPPEPECRNILPKPSPRPPESAEPPSTAPPHSSSVPPQTKPAPDPYSSPHPSPPMPLPNPMPHPPVPMPRAPTRGPDRDPPTQAHGPLPAPSPSGRGLG